MTNGEKMEKYVLVGKYAFLAGVVISIILGIAIGYMEWPGSRTPTDILANVYGWTTFVLLILGIIVGLTNITAKEATPFLIAAIALSLTRGTAFKNPLDMVHPLLGFWAYHIINFLVAFIAPAAIILAIKVIYALALARKD